MAQKPSLPVILDYTFKTSQRKTIRKIMRRLELLDYGRFFAAVMVLLFHYTFNGILNGKISTITHIEPLIEITKYGYLGVELFFMISGYVIFFSAKNRSPTQFAVSRAVRLYPSYWFAIIFTSFFSLLWGGEKMAVYFTQILVNLTMLQSWIGFSHVDGVYWSLAYEISFYAAVSIALLAGLQKHLESLFIIWPLLMCAAFFLNMEHLPYLGGYYYYFSAGALFAILKEKRNFYTIFPLLLILGLCVTFSLGVAEVKTLKQGTVYSAPIIAGIVSTFFVFFLLQNNVQVQSLRLPLSNTLGALTYPVYLIHAHFGYMFISQFATEKNKQFIYLLTVLIVISTAFIMHKLIELRLSSLWKWLFKSTLGQVITVIDNFPKKLKIAYKSYLN